MYHCQQMNLDPESMKAIIKSRTSLNSKGFSFQTEVVTSFRILRLMMKLIFETVPYSHFYYFESLNYSVNVINLSLID